MLFWACEKQDHDAVVVAPFMHSALPEDTDTEETLAAYREEFNRQISLCSMEIARENARARPPKTIKKVEVEARTSTFPIQ